MFYFDPVPVRRRLIRIGWIIKSTGFKPVIIFSRHDIIYVDVSIGILEIFNGAEYNELLIDRVADKQSRLRNGSYEKR